MIEKRFWSEDYGVGYYTEIVDNEKELEDVPNPKKNLLIEEVIDLLNELAEENKVLRSDRDYWKTLAQSLAKNNGNVKLKDEHLAWKRVDVE